MWREYLRSRKVPFANVIKRFRSYFGDALHVLNYDHYKETLFQTVCDILGVKPEHQHPEIRVNRSPTRSETECLLYINERIAASSLEPRDRADLTKKIYQQLIMRSVQERLRPQVMGDDLDVLATNNTDHLAYVNTYIRGAPLALYVGEVETGELVFNRPSVEVTALIDALLDTAIQFRARKSREKQPSARKAAT